MSQTASTSRLIAALALGLGLAGCPQPAPAPPAPPPAPPGPAYPAWIDSVPQDPQQVYAVGIAMRTMEGEAVQRDTARQRAVTQLAHSVKTKIKSVTAIHGQSSGESSSSESTDEDTLAETDELVKQCEVVESWTDHRGIISEFKGSIFVLVRVPRAVLYGK